MSQVEPSRRWFSCCGTAAGVLRPDRNSRQRALISVAPIVRQVAPAAFSVPVCVAVVMMMFVMVADRRRIVPDCCTVSSSLAARCRCFVDHRAGGKRPESGSHPVCNHKMQIVRHIILRFDSTMMYY